MHDVAFVGGGPGGLYAAPQLARRGCSVTVFEEHTTAGGPVHCTGVLAVEAFDEFELRRESILNPLTTAEFFSPSGQFNRVRHSGSRALVIDRLAFDRRLADDARAAGVQPQVGQRVTNARLGDRDVSIERMGAPEVRARACVLACGASYLLQRRLGLGMPPLHLQSAEMEVPARFNRHRDLILAVLSHPPARRLLM